MPALSRRVKVDRTSSVTFDSVYRDTTNCYTASCRSSLGMVVYRVFIDPRLMSS